MAQYQSPPPPYTYPDGSYAQPDMAGATYGGQNAYRGSNSSTLRERQKLINNPRFVADADGYDQFGGYSGPSDEDSTPQKAVNMWGRTFFLICVFMGLTALLCTMLLLQVKNGLYWAFGWAFGCSFIFSWICTWFCSCFYRKAKNDVNWAHTLRTTVFWCTLLTGLSITIGGYFLRELNGITTGVSYASVSVKDSPKANGGEFLSFAGAARVYPEYGGRTVGFGVFPVCVAPILELATDKTVNYWAVSNGPCCAKNPMDCVGWTDGVSRGGTILKYQEVYPNTDKASEQSRDPPLNMLPNPNAVYVRYGDVSRIKQDLKNYGILVLCLGLGLTLILGLYKSCSGPY